MKSFSRQNLSLALVFIFSACKVAGPRPVDTSPHNSALTYFVSEQYATEADLGKYMSGLFGEGMIAPQTASLRPQAAPYTPTCLLSSQDGTDFAPLSGLDIGDLKISGGHLPETVIAKNPKSGQIVAQGVLEAGTYTIENVNYPGNTAFKQSFTVPGNGSDIALTSGTSAVQKIPSPKVPASTDPDYIIKIDKSQNLFVSFTPPPDIDYVRVIINDGGGEATDSITCYGNPKETLGIPANALSVLKSSTEGLLQVDFVKSSLQSNQGSFKENAIISFVRHFHGPVSYNDGTQTITNHFGYFVIE